MEKRIWHEHYDYNVLPEYRFPRIPAHEMLNIPANAVPDKPAYYFYGNSLTFWELKKKVGAMATVLQELGVQKGDRVGLHLPNLPQYLIAYYATLSLGAIVVNFNPLYTADELKILMEQTGVSTLFTFDMVIPVVKEICKSYSFPRIIGTSVFDFMGGEVSTPESLQLEKEWYHFSTLLNSVKTPKRPRVEIKDDDPALIQLTGGTTDIPKGAVLTQANLVAATFLCSHWGASTIQYTPIEKRNVMCALPFFHIYANVVCMNWAMVNCATMILVPRFEVEPVIDLISTFENITFFPAVPTMISALVNHPKALEKELPKRICLLNSGGAPIPVELIEKVKDLEINVGEGWGMSETTSLGTSNPILGLKKAGSIGLPFPGMDVRIVDAEDGETDLPIGESGELLVKGPLVMKEYWNNPAKTQDELKNGWLYTGDIAKMDEDGYLFIVDRKKDMIIAGGYNIYPRDIDEVLYQHPKIVEAVTIGVKHDYRGETVKAFIVLAEGETVTEQEIIDFCKQKLAIYKVPKIIEFRKELPKSAIGKILRKVLREEEEAKTKKH